jgi:L-2-hydroxyglutarate oxidase
MIYDYCVIGGGIIGLSTAMCLLDRQRGARLLLLEKEHALASHQSGHNSGVIHAGIYYAPGSLKARLCRKGGEATKRFCAHNKIPFETCGKLLVATHPRELARMSDLQDRAQKNGIACERLDRAALNAVEPEIAGLGALLIPATGIVDYKAVCAAMARRIEERGGEIQLGRAVTGIRESEGRVTIEFANGQARAARLVACAGLQSDRLARMAGLAIDHSIVPFRGEYYVLRPRAAVFKHLIYPIPDPDLPFLGIHLTLQVDGSVTVGPNAVLGFAREGYAKGSLCFKDMADLLAFPGFWRVAAAHWRSGLGEFANSLSKTRYLAECRKYCPRLALDDLGSAQTGIRAQAVMHDGTLVHDFLFVESERMLHVCNAPSPAATSAIPIGNMIVDQLMRQCAH